MSQIADMFMEPDADPRNDPSPVADERTTLVEFLRWQRETLDLKCAGLTPEQLARQAVACSTLSLLGLVRHMADVERHWFRRIMNAENAPPHFRTPEDPDAAFNGAVPDPACVAEAWAAWRGEIANSERFVAAAPNLEITGNESWRGPMSLRWVLVHMIEEHARHNGHADLLRQKLDGRVGQ
jgi:uncharacterized damage-inducible protein DinB